MFKVGNKVRLKKQENNSERYFMNRYKKYKDMKLTIKKKTRIGGKETFEIYNGDEYVGAMYESEIEHIKERNEI